MRTSLSLAATVGLGLVIAGSAVPAHADSHDDAAHLSVLHAVPELPVDVYVNGELTLDDFSPGDLAGPLELPGGEYEIALTAADAEDDSDPVLGPFNITLEAGTNYTAAAHLGAEGDPRVTPFVNDTSQLDPGDGRLTVRHIAAAPEVDIWADGDVAVESLANPDEEMLELPAGMLEAAVSLAGESDPVLGPAEVEVAEGANTIVYAWGSAEDGTLDLAMQTVGGAHSAPEGVPAGNYQVPVQQSSGGYWIAGIGALALLAVGGAATLGARRPHKARV